MTARPQRWPARPSWLKVVREPSAMESPSKVAAPIDAVRILRDHGAETELVEVFYVLLLDAQN